MIDDKLLTETAYVSISKYRTKALKTINNQGVMIPTRIAEESGILRNHISKTLSELREHGLVECVNPSVRKGRLYRLTDVGSEVVKYL